MLSNEHHQTGGKYQMELVCLDQLVPSDHLLRVMEEQIDFSFITDKVRPFYSQKQGRPSIPPVRLFKMMLIGYLFGIRSERQLEQEIQLNVAYRWFLGLGLSEKVPDHSTISWNRNQRFQGTQVFQEIFDEVVRLALSHRMVAGRLLITDSTHVRADANNNRYTVKVVEDTPLSYLDELEQAVSESRATHGKKPLPPPPAKETSTKQKVSQTDPQSGYMMRKGKPEGFYYLEHRTVDHKFNLITDVHVTAGNVNDSTVYLERLNRQVQTFGFAETLESVALDSGYMTPHICKHTRFVMAVIAERTPGSIEGMLGKTPFVYDADQDFYVCPAGEKLTYRTTNRLGYAEYMSDPSRCKTCPLLNRCTQSQNQTRVIQRHVWEEHKEHVRRNRLSELGKKIYKLRCQTIERSFADAKNLHGYRRCRMRGREKVQEQALMTAIAQNLKKIARYLGKKGAAYPLFVNVIFKPLSKASEKYPVALYAA